MKTKPKNKPQKSFYETQRAYYPYLITLSELAKKFKINKSQLNYYAWMKLFKPVMIAGKTMFFNKNIIIKQLKDIKTYKKKGKTLKEIQKLLK